MNIFFLDRDEYQCAIAHNDKHVVKMILEYAQLLSTAHRELDGDTGADEMGMYKRTHVNHPSAVWVRQSSRHYIYVYRLFRQLCWEYHYRYGKQHKTEVLLLRPLAMLPDNIPQEGWTDPPQCMDNEYKVEGDTVQAYRNYYNQGKAHLKQWTIRLKPDWITDETS